MDEKEIRAKADKLIVALNKADSCVDMGHDFQLVEAALTEVGDAQWDAALEAAIAKAPGSTEHSTVSVRAIRRLKRSKG